MTHESGPSDPPCCDCGEYLVNKNGILQCPVHGLDHAETRVVNIHHEKAQVYIGRGSKWGNPFHIGKDGTREEVIEKYHQYILGNSQLLTCLHELNGKTLGCYCKPLFCHGDVLVELINRK